ncbi:MAG: hypothetical protein HC831_30735 [Chloroflexia bacterium]|nr:hypothetical protein [Chloroflexia bacterium]
MKFNQLFILLFILLSIVNSTSSKMLGSDSTRYRVLKGEIICDEPQWLIITFVGREYKNNDSIFLKNGINHIKYKGLEASDGDEDLYLLTFTKKATGQLWLYFSEDTITVNIDMTKPRFLHTDKRKVVFGSPATLESYDQEKVVVSIHRKKITLKEKRDSLLFYDPDSSKINNINRKIDSLLNAVENYYIKYALTSRYSCNATFFFNWFNSR